MGKNELGPTQNNVCRCVDDYTKGRQCYNGQTLGCPLSVEMAEEQKKPEYVNNNFSLRYFEWNCTECNCYLPEDAPTPPTPGPPPASPLERWLLIAAIAI